VTLWDCDTTKKVDQTLIIIYNTIKQFLKA